MMINTKNIGFLLLLINGILFLVLPLVETSAQESQNVFTNQIWLDYNPTYQISEKLDFKGSVGARTVFPNTWYRFWVRQYVSYDWPRLILKKARFREQLDGGLDIYYTINKDNVDILELTPFQAYSLMLPNRERLVIRHYLMLEERFELQTDEWDNNFGLRLSYQTSMDINFHGGIWKYGKGFYIPVIAQFYWNLIGTKQFNDKIRITPGIGYHASPEWKIAFLVGYNYTRTDADEEFHNNDVIYRLRIYHNIPRKKD